MDFSFFSLKMFILCLSRNKTTRKSSKNVTLTPTKTLSKK